MSTWLVTGASSGIGYGTALAALEAGEWVAGCARGVDAMEELGSLFPDTFLAVPLDVTDAESRKNAVARATKRFGDIDVLVNCAGSGYRAGVEEGAPDRLEALMQVNAYGPLELTRLVLPSMRNRRAGLVVDVTSIGGIRGAACNGYYSASKAALEMIDDALRSELAGLGVDVLTVEPGAFRTGFYRALDGAPEGIADYDAAIAGMRVGGFGPQADQPGDPLAAGRAIVDVALDDERPARLALGSDAVRILRETYRQRLEELGRWEGVSASTDFSD